MDGLLNYADKAKLCFFPLSLNKQATKNWIKSNSLGLMKQTKKKN